MKLGLYGINLGPCANPQASASVARAAEEAGFESVWTVERLVYLALAANPEDLIASVEKTASTLLGAR